MNPGGGHAGLGEPGKQIGRIGDLHRSDHEPAQGLGIVRLGSHGTQLYGGGADAGPAGLAVHARSGGFAIDW